MPEGDVRDRTDLDLHEDGLRLLLQQQPLRLLLVLETGEPLRISKDASLLGLSVSGLLLLLLLEVRLRKDLSLGSSFMLVGLKWCWTEDILRAWIVAFSNR